MAVSDNKLIKASRRFSTTIGAGGVANDSATTVPLSDVPGLFSNGDAIEFIVDRVSTTGTLTTDKEETIVGEVSGTNIINCARGVEGTAQAHSAGAVVEIKLTADMWNRMIEWGLTEHSQDGTHSDITATTLTTSGAADLETLAINSGTAMTAVLDEDDMASDSATALATQQSIKAYNDSIVKTASDGATVTFDLGTGAYRKHNVVLGGNRTLALSNALTGMAFIISLTQDGTGSRTVTWFSTIRWAGGSAPTLTTTLNKRDTFGFICTGTDTYDGYIVGQNL